ncbi:YafY family transcriptional regulator [Lentzea tibetensis]|uniref:YafY family transcriptional regulator n=1 Tax=Lentzea tibetensis TaxID=2591470 RepID=A0A563ERT3_9PSEU|nr:YafY family protein [Lentzea tibetensis]TWP49571.1 YafY family transcriptional regulator [Lentzea tibetensis]
MTDTPARLLRLLSLLQTPREWPGSELADRLEVSMRTVRRDVDRLRELGYPVEATMGALGGYRLVAGAAMPPLLLEDDEAVAIAVGLRSAHAVEGVEEASVRALTKLEQVLPSRLRRRVSNLHAATVRVTSEDTPVDPEVLTTLAAAITNRERLRFAYRDEKRHTEPHRLVSAGRRWYLLAFDLERDDWRIFRVDRLSEPFPTGARITPRELPADAATYFTKRMYSLAPVYEMDVTLRMRADQVPDGLGEVTPADDGTCRLRTAGDTLGWLAMRVATLGCEFVVNSPPELVEHFRELGTRVMRCVDQSSVDTGSVDQA